MKFRLTWLLFISMFIICQSAFAQEADSTSYAQIYFEKSEHNFGELNQGERVEQIFTFQNNGKVPLVLANVLSTCGCTIPKWPKTPIEPGKTDSIKVVFDSTAKIGRQNKVITIRSNSKEGDYRLRISAMVLPPKD